jgi:Eukaryotic aspartyl protease
MDPQDFIFGQSGDTCLGVLAASEFLDQQQQELIFILGATFMKNVITIFDMGVPRVGFGQIKSVSKQYGDYTIVPDEQATALGTGPSASVKATYKAPPPQSNHFTNDFANYSNRGEHPLESHRNSARYGPYQSKHCFPPFANRCANLRWSHPYRNVKYSLRNFSPISHLNRFAFLTQEII